MRARRLAACMLGLLAAQSVFADPAARVLKASEAARTANYRGVVIYRAGSTLESLRVVHGFEGGVERERLSALTGEAREILRQDNRVTCLLPRERKLDFQRPALKGLLTHLTPESLRQLQSWYELRDLGSARIAGRNCRGVELAPRDDYRYGLSIWSDDERGVPLKVAITGPGRQVLEEVMFTEIDFPASLPLQAFEPELDREKFRSVSRREPDPGAVADLSDLPIRFGDLPPGFRVTLHEHRPARSGQGVVEHVLISDGFMAVSVFAAPDVPAEKAVTGLTRMGAVHAWGGSFGRLQVTVMGEAPAATVKRIGEGIEPVKP